MTMKIEIKVRDYGTMIAELYPEKAPKTVENFLGLIDRNFFDGLIFHRIIAGFMIQGGGYNENCSRGGSAAPGRTTSCRRPQMRSGF